MTYRLSNTAPISRITESEYGETCGSTLWRQQVKRTLDLDVPPQIKRKAAMVDMLVGLRAAARRGKDPTSHFAYKLGDQTVGLMSTKRRKDAMEVSLLIAHPGVENAGDVLLEHALRQSGPNAKLTLAPVNDETSHRYQTLGFEPEGSEHSGWLSLSPKLRPDVWTDQNGEWTRVGKGKQYLVADDVADKPSRI